MNSTTDVKFSVHEPRNAQEFADLIQNTTVQIEKQFGQMSDSILTKIDDIGRQIDEFERNIAHVMSNSTAELR